MRYAVSGSCIMRWLITRKFNLQPDIVNIHVVTDLVKFEDMVEPQTVDCKIPSSLHYGTPKHKSTLLEITLSTLTAYVRHVYEHVVMYTNMSSCIRTRAVSQLWAGQHVLWKTWRDRSCSSTAEFAIRHTSRAVLIWNSSWISVGSWTEFRI